MPEQVVTGHRPNAAFRAAFVPDSLNADARTIDVVFSTGAKALRRYSAQLDIWKPFYEELSLDPRHVDLSRFNNNAPLSDGHPLLHGDARAALNMGTVVPGSAKTDGKQGTATVRFSSKGIDPQADMLFLKVQDGIVGHVSIGYRVRKAEQQIVLDSEAIPTYRAIDWEPIELSTVSVGEDDGATFRGAALTMTPCEFITRSAEAIDADRHRRIRLAYART